MKIAVIPALAALALVSCATPQAPGPISTAPLTLGLGQSHDAGGVIVKPLAILEESRCPADVMCIQAGTIRLNVEIRRGASARTYEVGAGRPADIGGTWLRLLSACPYPLADRPSPPPPYRFTFLLSGSPETERHVGCNDKPN